MAAAGGGLAVLLPAPRSSSLRRPMAEIQPLRALHYDLARTGGLQPVVAPPYDVIDEAQRTALEARSPFNVVRIDLPRPSERTPDPYVRAAEILERWRADGIVVRDSRPALWALEQDYTGPDGRARTRRGFLARVRVEEYGAGRIRPHERTHPGPKEDRLRLTRATKANLSPIFSLYSDPTRAAWKALEAHTEKSPWGETRDAEGAINRLWRIGDERAIAEAAAALAGTELLIADGHHRYETSRVYAEEIGGEGPQRYVLMCLVALEDPGLTVFPTHRLIRGLSAEQIERLAEALRRDFEIVSLESLDELYPEPGERVRIGYIDAHFKKPYMLTLKDQAIADRVLPRRSEPYRRLDTAVLEALILRGALGMSELQIERLEGLGYARDDEEALKLVRSGTFDAAFMMSPPPIGQVRAIAAAGESMPPKSTYFFPKVPTGLLFNPLED
jgi:uncharacterized protein (DUF1015 family)